MVTKNKNGFTLIELLVVIAVIAVLMGILIPALGKARKAAQQITCAAHQRGFGVSFLAYVDDNDQWSHWGPNLGFWFSQNPRLQYTEKDMLDKDLREAYWGIAYYPYAENMELFHCPSSRYQLLNWDGVNDPEAYYWAHYGLNGFASNRKISKIRRPAEMIVIQDHFEQKLDNNGDMMHIKPKQRFQWNLTQWRNHSKYPDAMIEIYRHGRTSISVEEESPWSPIGTGVSNTLWLDGHVAPIRQSLGEDVLPRWYTGGVGDGSQPAWYGYEMKDAIKKRF